MEKGSERGGAIGGGRRRESDGAAKSTKTKLMADNLHCVDGEFEATPPKTTTTHIYLTCFCSVT